MSKIREFFVMLPRACGVPEELAGEFGTVNGKLFDWEIANPGSILSRQEGQSILERLAPAWKGWGFLSDPRSLAFGMALSVFLVKSIDLNGKGIGDPMELKSDKTALLNIEPNHPEVSALATVEWASVQSNWV